jgi:hypothetical protein
VSTQANCAWHKESEVKSSHVVCLFVCLFVCFFLSVAQCDGPTHTRALAGRLDLTGLCVQKNSGHNTTLHQSLTHTAPAQCCSNGISVVRQATASASFVVRLHCPPVHRVAARTIQRSTTFVDRRRQFRDDNDDDDDVCRLHAGVGGARGRPLDSSARLCRLRCPSVHGACASVERKQRREQRRRKRLTQDRNKTRRKKEKNGTERQKGKDSMQ